MRKEDALMVMDIAVFAIFVISIFLSMRRGLALMVSGLMKGIVAATVAWIFCDNLADALLRVTPIHDFVVGRISEQLSVRWENSAIYGDLPTLFTQAGNNFSETIITEGATKLAWLFLTIIGFLLIFVGIRFVGYLIQKNFSHKEREGFIGFSDKMLGLVLGIIVGIFNVLLVLALLLPICGFVAPGLSEQLPTWFEGSYFAKDIYDNNLLLILIRDFIC